MHTAPCLPRTLTGLGLFTGEPCTLHLTPQKGPVTLAHEGRGATPIAALTLARTVLSTGVRLSDGATVLTVEHLFAALAGLGIYEGVALDVHGPEVPLMDGRARAFADALAPFRSDPGRSERRDFRIAKLATVAVDDALYRFSPSSTMALSVHFQHENPAIVPHARWEGSAEHFRTRIAGARTFASQADLEKYAARGVRATLDPTHLVVVGPDRIYAAGEPAAPDEPARHKLLDLIGDLYLHGGPFEGTIYATRPGHAKTHEAVRRAKATGILLPRGR